MKPRRATLLLAAMFALLGCADYPCAGAAVLRPSAAIVRMAPSRRAERKTAQIFASRVAHARPAPLRIAAPRHFVPVSAALDARLFQRPPPRVPSLLR